MEVAREDTGRLNAGLERLLEEGYFLLRRAKPAVRHAAYMAMTLPDELTMLLDSEYMDKLEAGQAQLPRSVQIVDSMRPAIVDEKTGEVSYPIKEANRWRILMGLPDWFVRKVLADFREVHAQAEKRAADAGT